MTLRDPYRHSPSNPAVAEIQTKPERVADMPYAPAMRVKADTTLLFVSGATPSPLYHKHPHVYAEHDHPTDIRAQVHLTMANIKEVLDHEGLTWTDVVKVNKYLTDARDFEVMTMTLKEYFGDWTPASTTLVISALSTPGARLEIECVVAYPSK